MTTNRTEAIAGLVLLAFTAFAWNAATGIRGAAAMFPRAIIVVIGVFSLIYLVRSLVKGRKSEPIFKRWHIFAVVLVGSVIYVQMVVAVGYVTSSLLFIPIMSWIIGFRRPIYIAVATTTYVASVHLLFDVVFNRPMPDDFTIELLRGFF